MGKGFGYYIDPVNDTCKRFQRSAFKSERFAPSSSKTVFERSRKAIYDPEGLFLTSSSSWFLDGIESRPRTLEQLKDTDEAETAGGLGAAGPLVDGLKQLEDWELPGWWSRGAAEDHVEEAGVTVS